MTPLQPAPSGPPRPARPRSLPPGPGQVEALVERLLSRLDWATLGSIYCEGDGEAFWAELRPAVAAAGAVWGRELMARLRPRGRSLYVGAGVAELPALVAECVGLGRICVASNLREAECEVLDAGLVGLGLGDRLWIEPRDAITLLDRGPFDHVAVVSVLSDPETFPAVSDVGYGRIAPIHLDVAAFEAERAAIRGLVGGLVDALERPAVVTTTAEEVAWFLEAAEQRGLIASADEVMLEMPVVGDTAGLLHIEAAP